MLLHCVYISVERQHITMKHRQPNERLRDSLTEKSLRVRGKGGVKIYEDVNFNVTIVEKMHVRYL